MDLDQKQDLYLALTDLQDRLTGFMTIIQNGFDQIKAIYTLPDQQQIRDTADHQNQVLPPDAESIPTPSLDLMPSLMTPNSSPNVNFTRRKDIPANLEHKIARICSITDDKLISDQQENGVGVDSSDGDELTETVDSSLSISSSTSSPSRQLSETVESSQQKNETDQISKMDEDLPEPKAIGPTTPPPLSPDPVFTFTPTSVPVKNTLSLPSIGFQSPHPLDEPEYNVIMVCIPLKKLFSVHRLESRNKTIRGFHFILRVEDGGRWPLKEGKGRRLGLFLRCQGPAPTTRASRCRVVNPIFKIHNWLGSNKPALVQVADEMEFAEPFGDKYTGTWFELDCKQILLEKGLIFEDEVEGPKIKLSVELSFDRSRGPFRTSSSATQQHTPNMAKAPPPRPRGNWH